MKKKIYSGFIAVIGFLLSPLSWWNDLIVNFPISYALALPFGLINRSLFLPMFIVNYWITNIAGLVMLHVGINGARNNEDNRISKKEFFKTIAFGLVYTTLIVTLILTGVLEFPEEFLDKFIEITK